MCQVRGAFKILVGLGQVLTSFVRTFEIPWPGSFHRVFEYCGFTNLAPFAFPGFACLFRNMDFYTTTLVYFATPLLLAAYMLIAYRTLLWWVRSREHNMVRPACVLTSNLYAGANRRRHPMWAPYAPPQ